MTEAPDITAEAVRKNLLDRAAAFRDAHNQSFSAISEAATKDSKFLARVQAGENFTIRSYQRVIDWLDEAEAKAAA
jgi:hypothetical protein